MHSMKLAGNPARFEAEESRTFNVSARVTHEDKEFVRNRAKQEIITESEYIDRLIEADKARQCLQGKSVDPQISALEALFSEIPLAIADGRLDQIEKPRLVRLAIRAADRLVNEEKLA